MDKKVIMFGENETENVNIITVKIQFFLRQKIKTKKS